ncbi:MAG: GEVED domain-containing protein, partial [Verrucomicrobiota bacterium]
MNGGTSADAWTLSSDGANLTLTAANPTNRIDVSAIPGATGDGSTSVTIPLAGFTGDILVNGIGGDDTLTIDFSLSDFADQILYDGGAGGSDDLVLTGGSGFDTALFGFVSDSAGSVDITGNQTITYSNLEPITSLINASNVILNYSAASETIAITAIGTGTTRVDSTVGEVVTFNNPSNSLVINAGAGDDTVNVTGLGGGFVADLTIDTQDGAADSINVNGAINTGGGDVNLVASFNINLQALVTTGGGDFNVDADRDDIGGGGFVMGAADGWAAGVGNSHIIAATVAWNAAAVASGTGTLLIEPSTAASTMNLGGGAGLLGLADIELDNLADGFSQITIGNATAGTLSLNTANFTDPVALITAGIITDLGNAGLDVDSPGNSVTFDGDVSPNSANPGRMDIGGDIILAADSSLSIDIGGDTPGEGGGFHGHLASTGEATISSNVALTITQHGGFAPLGGEDFVILDNGGTNPVTGTFTNRPEGYVFTNFFGSGIEATLSYLGGDGNDVVIFLPGLDYGDAPDSTGGNGANDYDTLLANDGPRHVELGPRLGTLRDDETDGFNSALADGDDNDGVDDEDGVTFGTLEIGQTTSVAVNVQITNGFLDAWIDYGRDGVFGAADQIADNLAVSVGVNQVSFTIDCTNVVGGTFARFRLSSAGDLDPTGIAADGEVEDYQVTLAGDSTAPVVSCPATITVDCDISEAPAYVSLVDFQNAGGSATDVCGLDPMSFMLISEVSDTNSCPETVTRTYEISDFNGNTSTCQQVISIRGFALGAGAWTQVGQSLDGTAGSSYGSAISLSGDGSRLTVGGQGHTAGQGLVRNFELGGGTWNQLGPDLVGGAAGRLLGAWVSLSDDGTRMAAGAFGPNPFVGRANTYEFTGPGFTALAAPILGQANFHSAGRALAMDGDGDRIAVSSPLANTAAGRLRVFEYTGTWNQLGVDLDGVGAGDSLGAAVDMTPDGTRLVVSATGQAGARGHVRIYDVSGGGLSQVGASIVGAEPNEISGFSVGISDAGTRVVIGATNHDLSRGTVRIYEWNGVAWVQLGADIDGVAVSDFAGARANISGNGQRVAVGASQHDNQRGHVRVFEYDGGMWNQVGDDIDGLALTNRFGQGVSFSTDGSRLAIGADMAGGLGQVRVFDFIQAPVLPTITCATNLTVQCLTEAPAYTTYADFVADGGTATASCVVDTNTLMLVSEMGDGAMPTATVTRVYSIADPCGNAGVCTQLVFTSDNIAPVITCPTN